MAFRWWDLTFFLLFFRKYIKNGEGDNFFSSSRVFTFARRVESDQIKIKYARKHKPLNNMFFSGSNRKKRQKMGNLYLSKTNLIKSHVLGAFCFLAASIFIRSLSTLLANVDQTFVNTFDEKKIPPPPKKK